MRIPESGDYYRFKEAILALPYTIADECVSEEKGIILHNGTAELEWMPVRAGTIRGWMETGAAWEEGDGDVYKRVGGRVFVYDDMDGNLLVDGAIVGTVNYVTGAINLPPVQYRHSEYELQYFFDSGPKVRDMKDACYAVLNLVTAPVVANPRRLDQIWLEVE